MDYFTFPPFLFFLHTSHFVFGQQKKDTKNLLLIFDVFLLIDKRHSPKCCFRNSISGTKNFTAWQTMHKNNPFIW